MRNVYLNTKSLEEAMEIFHKNIGVFLNNNETEIINSKDALGRISKEAIFASYSSPSYNSSAVDGVMINSELTKEARENKPLFIKSENFKYCNTGDKLENPYNCAIMIEDIEEKEDGIEIRKSMSSCQNIRTIGEDVIEKDLIFTAYHKFSPVDLSVLISTGVFEVEVLKKPSIGIIPTGNEIIDDFENYKEGQIVESNSTMLKAMAEEIGAYAKVYPIVRDDKELLKASIEKARSQCDFITVIAGSSAGAKDYTREVLDELGEVFVHGLSIKPGKPAVIGKIEETPFVGLPGFPVACNIVFDKLVLPTVQKKLKVRPRANKIIEANLTKQVVTSLKNREYIRVNIGKVNDKLTATPLDRKAGSLYSLSQSDGYLIVYRNLEGYNRKDKVKISLHKDIDNDSLNNRLVVIGSNDMVIDVINDLLAKKGKKTRLLSSHVGSLSGLKALKDKDCHIAPSHLLDKDGSYNDDYIDLFFEKGEVVKLNVVGRRQGIYVSKDSEDIKTLADLPGKTMVNRQKGSGTRVLFDYLLDKNGIDPYEIKDYDNEVNTHIQAALKVKNKECDFSIGVESQAIKMGIDFIYLKDEEYQFILRKESLELEMVKEVIEIIKSQEFKEKMKEVGGYNTSHSGEIL